MQLSKLSCLLVLLCVSVIGTAAPQLEEPPPSPVAVQTPANDAGETAPDADDFEFYDPFDTESKEGAPQPGVSDPLQPVNRAFFRFNDRLYFWVLKPAATGYSKVFPEPMRQSVRRFFVNVRYPVRVVNNILQGKFKGAGTETARFLVNSTVGIGGLFDPAQDEWNLKPYPEDLDQTLGFYRLPPGIHLHWPLLGPSSVRGTVGLIGDSALSPWNYIDSAAVIYGTRAGDTLNATSLRLGEYESFKKAALDPYVALRDAYFENRRSLVEQ